jgi:GAF domain-containing protein
LPTAADHLTELKKWAAELSCKGNEEQGVRLNRAVELIATTFEVKLHEVAILGLTHDGRSLRFLAPETLRAIGQIPLSSGSALAARTMREMRPEIVNHFHVVPHASVFEGVPVAEDERAEPIQKIMSSPIMLGSKALGVLQVSRKGKGPLEAGPDFTPLQLRNLKTISDALAPCLLLCARE